MIYENELSAPITNQDVDETPAEEPEEKEEEEEGEEESE